MDQIQLLLNWIKNKKATTNPINKKDDHCFQYAATIALSQKEVGKNSERISKIKPLIAIIGEK